MNSDRFGDGDESENDNLDTTKFFGNPCGESGEFGERMENKRSGVASWRGDSRSELEKSDRNDKRGEENEREMRVSGQTSQARCR